MPEDPRKGKGVVKKRLMFRETVLALRAAFFCLRRLKFRLGFAKKLNRL